MKKNKVKLIISIIIVGISMTIYYGRSNNNLASSIKTPEEQIIKETLAPKPTPAQVTQDIPPIKDEKNVKVLVASLKDQGISLYSIGYGFSAASGDYGFTQFVLKINGKEKIFNWKNVDNPLFYPKLIYKKGQELTVVNTINNMTKLEKVVHKIKLSDLSELKTIGITEDKTINYKDEMDQKKLMKLMFPDMIFTEEKGVYIGNVVGYPCQYTVESVTKGSYTIKEAAEYLVVVTQTGMSHAGGLENRFVAVLDESKTKLKSKVKEFDADSGDIKTFKGKETSYIYFGGTRTYQGYTYSKDCSEIGLWKPGITWKSIWSEDTDYWEDHIPMATNNGINIYERKSFVAKPDDREYYAWELKSILKWDINSGTFKDEN